MGLLKLLDIRYEVDLSTLEVITMVVLRECDIEGDLISNLGSDQVFLESRNE